MTAVQEAPRRTKASWSVADVMSARPISLRPDDTLDVAHSMMRSLGIHHLPVTDGDRLVGLITIGDLLRVGLPEHDSTPRARDWSLRGVRAREAMTADPQAVSPGSPLRLAAELVLRGHLSCLPVADEGRLVGILTRSDFLDISCDLIGCEEQLQARPVQVTRLMTSAPLHTVAPDERLDVAHVLMKTERIRQLLVVEHGVLVGLLSDHDVLGALGGGEAREQLLEKSQRHVSDVMRHDPHTIGPDGRALEIGRRMRKQRESALPVLSHGKLVGILTPADYFHYFVNCSAA